MITHELGFYFSALDVENMGANSLLIHGITAPA
jgi:hypothetical protein